MKKAFYKQPVFDSGMSGAGRKVLLLSRLLLIAGSDQCRGATMQQLVIAATAARVVLYPGTGG